MLNPHYYLPFIGILAKGALDSDNFLKFPGTGALAAPPKPT
jgi:hypothetical protein